jgi:ketosteroid isomerase-like protein
MTKPVTLDLLKQIGLAFCSRDVDRIMAFFAEDATFYMASGPEAVGRTVVGKAAIHKVFADRFKVIPDMYWAPEYDVVAGPDRGVSVWCVTGTATDGTKLDAQGCDLFEFRDGLIWKKDTYWKIVRPD